MFKGHGLLAVSTASVTDRVKSSPVRPRSACVLGRLAEVKEWFLATPVVAFLKNAEVESAWEAETPGFEAILPNIAATDEESDQAQPSASTFMKPQTPYPKEVMPVDTR